MSMSRIAITCQVIGLIVIGALGASAATPASAVACPRVEVAPTLDGHLDDWPALPQAVIAEPGDWRPASERFAEYGGPGDISAEVRLAWDNQALYLAVQTRDDASVRVRSAAEIDRGDSIVIGLAGEGAEHVDQFVVALLRAASLVWRAEPADRAGEVRTIGRALAIQEQNEEGFILVYELAIPWTELEQMRPIAGSRFTLSVSACDDDGQGLKGCLEGSLGAVLSGTGTGPVSARAAIRPPSVAPSFPAPERARFDERALILNGKPVLLIGGEVEYSHLPREVWQDRLDRLQAAGLNAVGVTVPWAHHQPTPTPAELGDLRAFLELCKRAGVWVQINIGPFAGETWEAGDVPGWVVALGSPREVAAATDKWLAALLPLVAEYQLSAGGPVAYVVIRPLPDDKGEVKAAALEPAFAAVRSAKIVVPVATANAPAARSTATQALTDLLDTVSFYEPVAPEALVASLQALGEDEVGPVVISALPGDYRTPASARRSMDRVRMALAMGAGVVMLSDFAPGFDPAAVRPPGDWTGQGAVDPAGALTPGYGEARLVGDLIGPFGPVLASAIGSGERVQVDDPDVRAMIRYGKEQALLLLWDQKGAKPHQVRLSYTEPGKETPISVPEAGAIHLPPGGARALPLEVPLGRGVLRYCTSEVASVGRLGDRALMAVYGDVDTPGEIAIRLPGPPLVSGEAVRQRWDQETKTLFLDYYHEATDKYLLVDELVIAVLCRERAMMSLSAAGEPGATTMSAGANVAKTALGVDGLKAELDCPAGTTEVTVALPQAPSAVMVDGKPAEFSFTTPERVLRLRVETSSFEEEQKADSVWQRLGRAVVGGPPRVYARFDRGMFMPDGEARGGASTSLSLAPPQAQSRGGECGTFRAIFGAPEKVGLRTGGFARLKTRFSAQGPTELVMSGSRYPALVFVNGRLVPALSADSPLPRADITPYLAVGENELEIVVQVLPLGPGAAGLNEDDARLPEVRIVTESGAPALEGWQVCPGLAGEAAGFAGSELDTKRWHLIRFGPWREQGRELSDVWGPGWYRVSFELPRSGDWRIPYYLDADLKGAGKLYLGGRPLATVSGDGKYVLPLSAPPLAYGESNCLAAALYGVEEQTGLYELSVAADQSRMTKRRVLEVRF